MYEFPRLRGGNRLAGGSLRTVAAIFFAYRNQEFNDWGGRGYDDFVPGEVTKTAPSGDETT